jgi:hypothetical protein
MKHIAQYLLDIVKTHGIDTTSLGATLDNICGRNNGTIMIARNLIEKLLNDNETDFLLPEAKEALKKLHNYNREIKKLTGSKKLKAILAIVSYCEEVDTPLDSIGTSKEEKKRQFEQEAESVFQKPDHEINFDDLITMDIFLYELTETNNGILEFSEEETTIQEEEAIEKFKNTLIFLVNDLDTTTPFLQRIYILCYAWTYIETEQLFRERTGYTKEKFKHEYIRALKKLKRTTPSIKRLKAIALIIETEKDQEILTAAGLTGENTLQILLRKNLVQIIKHIEPTEDPLNSLLNESKTHIGTLAELENIGLRVIGCEEPIQGWKVIRRANEIIEYELEEEPDPNANCDNELNEADEHWTECPGCDTFINTMIDIIENECDSLELNTPELVAETLLHE